MSCKRGIFSFFFPSATPFLFRSRDRRAAFDKPTFPLRACKKRSPLAAAKSANPSPQTYTPTKGREGGAPGETCNAAYMHACNGKEGGFGFHAPVHTRREEEELLLFPSLPLLLFLSILHDSLVSASLLLLFPFLGRREKRKRSQG